MRITLSQRDIDKIKAGETLIETEEVLIEVEDGIVSAYDKINRNKNGSYKKCQVMNTPKL